MYLVLGVDAPRIRALYPKNTTLDTITSSWLMSTGLSPFWVLHFSKLQLSQGRLKNGQHHISNTFRHGIRFVLCRVQSPLLTASHWFLFLRVLRRFSSPSSSIFRSAIAGMRSYSDILGSKATCAYPKLIAACRVLHQHTKPSYPPSSLQHRFALLPMFGFINMNIYSV